MSRVAFQKLGLKGLACTDSSLYTAQWVSLRQAPGRFWAESKEGNSMRRASGIGLALALSVGIGLGTMPLSSYEAAAQTTLTIRGEECGVNLLAVCSNTESETGEGGDATSRGGNGGNGGNGGFASIGGVGNAFAAGGNAQAGTTGGYGIGADASGGNGGDGGNSSARGGNSGDSDVDSCNALLIGCFDTLGLGI